jgi:Zn-dependent M28 family amino/carboxypeptidase
VPGRFVAEVNIDMFLPLHPMRSVVAYGAEESTLREPLERAARANAVGLLPDREPNRVLFIRSDQYSFVRTGVPSLSLKLGTEPGSPEEKLQKTWLKERYHAPSDDLAQPMDREAAAAFTRFVADLVRNVADGPPPRWNDDSFFKRFAPK